MHARDIKKNYEFCLSSSMTLTLQIHKKEKIFLTNLIFQNIQFCSNCRNLIGSRKVIRHNMVIAAAVWWRHIRRVRQRLDQTVGRTDRHALDQVARVLSIQQMCAEDEILGEVIASYVPACEGLLVARIGQEDQDPKKQCQMSTSTCHHVSNISRGSPQL